eukprot:988026-Rhodomonas_salina.4
MACPQQARLVVVGADEEEQTFAFESLVENDDGMRHPCNCSKILNHLALVLHSYGAAVLGVVTVRLLFGGMQGFKELRIYCGDMTWILPGIRTRAWYVMLSTDVASGGTS